MDDTMHWFPSGHLLQHLLMFIWNYAIIVQSLRASDCFWQYVNMKMGHLLLLLHSELDFFDFGQEVVINFFRICICHGLPDLPTSDRPTDDHSSAHWPLSSPLCLANHLDNTWCPTRIATRWQPISHQKPRRYHQMSRDITPPHTVSHLNSHIKVTPLT